MTAPRSLPSATTLEDVLRAGRDALARGSVGSALRTFDEALRIKPTYAPAWKAKGRAHRAAGDPKAALECYAEALRYDPADEGSWFGLALVLHELGRRDEELEAYDELLRKNPRNAAAWMNRGVALHEEGRYEEALECYDKILSLRPESAAAWNDRGAALIRLGRFEEALVALDEAIALEPGLEDALANRQSVLGRLRREEAIPEPIELVEAVLPSSVQQRVLANMGLGSVESWRGAKPQTANDYVAFGTVLLDAGMADGAQAAFGKAVSLGAGADAKLGKLQAMRVRNDPRTVAEAGRVLAAHPDIPRIAIAAAAVREQVDDWAGAIEALDVILSHRPNLPWLWGWRGRLAVRTGRTEDAIRSFERATSEDPSDEEAWTNLAAMLHLAGRSKEALVACESALAASPESVSTWNNKGVILAAMGRHKDAEQAFETASARGSGPATLNRARLAETRGQFRAALDAYDAALKILSGDTEAQAGRRRVMGHLGARGRAAREKFTSRLSSIPGVGPATASRILKAGFDTAAKLRRVKESELAELAKLSKAQARAVKRAFNG